MGLPEIYDRDYRAPDETAYRRFTHQSVHVETDVLETKHRPNHALYEACDVRTLVEVSVTYKDELLGVLNVHTLGEPRTFEGEAFTLLRGIADHTAQAIVTARLFDQLRTSQRQLETLSRRLVQAQEMERRALARELHDEIGQILTVIRINLQTLHRGALAVDARRAAEASLSAVDGAIDRVRQLSWTLRPSLLDNLGLVPALRAFVDQQAQHAPFDASFSADRLQSRVPEALANAYFRITQEAMTNVMRHAQASHVSVALRVDDPMLVLIVRDDGVGFDLDGTLEEIDAERSLGLIGMRERAHLIGGTFEIRSAPEQGTEITVRTPLSPS
jgi:signal transduction histidine kinase